MRKRELRERKEVINCLGHKWKDLEKKRGPTGNGMKLNDRWKRVWVYMVTFCHMDAGAAE